MKKNFDLLMEKIIKKFGKEDDLFCIKEEDLHKEYLGKYGITHILFYLQEAYDIEILRGTKEELINILEDYPELLNDDILLILMAGYLLVDYREMEEYLYENRID